MDLKYKQLKLAPQKKLVMFTDIHFGRKGNSELHNQDCYEFVQFVRDLVQREPGTTGIAFLR